MPGDRQHGHNVRRFIVENVNAHPKGVVALTSTEFGITRQAVNHHIKKLVAQGTIYQLGSRKSTIYGLTRTTIEELQLDTLNLEEHVVWRDHISPALQDLPENVQSICQYGFTEMLNNVIDHAESTTTQILLSQSAIDTEIIINDQGEGIFKRICRLQQFKDEREAIFELSKGKLTTDPDRHTGEGIFFTSRMFDSYCIKSGGLFFSHESEDDSDWILESKELEGTSVIMQILNNSTRVDHEIFDSYADPENDPSFHKTMVPVALSRYKNEGLVSRSQAKRIMNRVDKFKTVILDFADIPSIGQAFADEIFRVFHNAHPSVEITTVNTTMRVSQMIKRVTN